MHLYLGTLLNRSIYTERSVHNPQDHLSPLLLATGVTDATLGASGLWLGTWTGAGGTSTLAFWLQPMAP